MADLQIRTAEVFAPLLEPARYKGAHGGRGSGKSHFFAEMAVEDALRFPGDFGEGIRFACIREVQKSLKDSAKLLLQDKLAKFGLGERQGFKVYETVIKTPGDGIFTFDGMQDHTAESFKSKEGFHRAWCEEAQTISDRSLTLLRPTIRWESKGGASELWFGWNPQRPTDPIDKLLRSDATPTGSRIVQANWRHNPWFPAVLDQERRDDLKNNPDKYPHVWEGEYATVLSGAYFARHLVEAEQSGRIAFFPRDPLCAVHAVMDIGGTSGRSDATVIWIVQFIGDEIRVIDHYEVVGQPFDAHVHWLRSKGYGDAIVVQPHDGKKHDVVYSITPKSFMERAGFSVEIIGNQGLGAALARVEAVRMIFPRVRFNKETTDAGRQALGWYHERQDTHRNIGLGPEHDWSSHSADAFGAVAIYAENRPRSGWGSEPTKRRLKGVN
jgi:phage terminase large subunit